MASTAFDVASVAAKIQTVAQVRAAMGAVTVALSAGYEKLSVFGPSTSIPNLVEGTRDAAFSLLDTVNKSAHILYNIYSDDPDIQNEDISTAHAISAGRIISEANDALKDVENAIGSNFSNVAAVVRDAIVETGTIAGTTVQGVTNAVAAGVSAFAFSAWPTLLLVGAGALIYINRKPILNALAKGLTL